MYSSLLTLDFRKRSVLDSDPVSREDCMKIGVTVKKNHCRQDRMPYLKTEYFVKYGVGTERSVEIIEIAVNSGILTKKGSWFREYGDEVDKKGEPIERTLPDGTKAAWNGLKNMRAYLVENPDYFEYLVNKVENFGKVDVETLSEEEVKDIEAEQKLEAQASLDAGIEDILENPDKKTSKKK